MTVRNSANLTYIKNIFWIFFEQFVKFLSLFLVNIYIARYLGPESFGLLSFSVGLVAIVIAASKLGLESILVRELVTCNDDRKGIIYTCFCMIMIASCVSVSLLLTILYVLNVPERTLLYVAILCLGALPQAFLVIEFDFQSQFKAFFSSLAKSTALLISAIVKLLIVYYDCGLLYIAIATSIEFFIIAIFLVIFDSKFNGRLFFKGTSFNFDTCRRILKSCVPMVASSVTTVLFMRMDQIILKIVHGDHAAGIYSAMSRIYEMWVMVTVVFCTAILPVLVKHKNESEEKFQSILVLIFRCVFMLTMIFSCIVSIYNKEITLLVYGESFLDGAIVLSILMWSSIFAALGSVTMRYFTVENFEKKIMRRAVFGLVVNLFLNILLIPSYGGLGAALSTLISLCLANYIIDYFDKDLKELSAIKNKAIFFTDFSLFRQTK